MDREVHFELTRRWALDEGFSETDAACIARANWACDSEHVGVRNLRYHWPLAGALVVLWLRWRRARREQDLVALGEALHALQDTIGHGLVGHLWHWPGIDRWDRRSNRVRRRLERWTRRLLAGYLRPRSRRRGRGTPLVS